MLSDTGDPNALLPKAKNLKNNCDFRMYPNADEPPMTQKKMLASERKSMTKEDHLRVKKILLLFSDALLKK